MHLFHYHTAPSLRFFSQQTCGCMQPDGWDVNLYPNATFTIIILASYATYILRIEMDVISESLFTIKELGLAVSWLRLTFHTNNN